MIVLDTNVVSELLRPIPASSVEAWLAAQDGAVVYFTAVGEAELRLGVAVLPAGRRRTALAAAIEDDFRDRILPFDRTAASAYAVIAADRRAADRPINSSTARSPPLLAPTVLRWLPAISSTIPVAVSCSSTRGTPPPRGNDRAASSRPIVSQRRCRRWPP